MGVPVGEGRSRNQQPGSNRYGQGVDMAEAARRIAERASGLVEVASAVVDVVEALSALVK